MARITVGMPAYNGEANIAEAIESIMKQTFRDLVLLISDNASTDGTEEICRRYAEMDERIKYVRQSRNLGATENYNYVCRQSGSEYFKWHSSNDLCTAETIERCIDLLDTNPDVVLCYPPTKLFEHSLDDATVYDDLTAIDSDSPTERFFHVIDNMTLNNVMNGVARTAALNSTALIGEFFYADRNMVAELALLGKIRLADNCCFYRRMDAASATILRSESEALAHFDPEWKRPLAFMNWRIYVSFLSSLFRSNIGMVSAIRAIPPLLRRAWWAKADLFGDIGIASRYALHDIRTAMSRKSD